jgi:hypothetical protein
MSDSDYFRVRASQERAAAEQATDPFVRQIHVDLAQRYEEAAQAALPTAQLHFIQPGSSLAT